MITLPNELFFAEVVRSLHAGHSVRITLAGNSMLPFLRSGRESVLIAPFTPGELHPGAIVLFHYRGQYLLHRIVRRQADHFTLCGDANLIPEYADLPDIAGIVRSIHHPSGRITPCHSLRWRFQSYLWMLLRPVRRYLMAIYRRICPITD